MFIYHFSGSALSRVIPSKIHFWSVPRGIVDITSSATKRSPTIAEPWTTKKATPGYLIPSRDPCELIRFELLLIDHMATRISLQNRNVTKVSTHLFCICVSRPRYLCWKTSSTKRNHSATRKHKSDTKQSDSDVAKPSEVLFLKFCTGQGSKKPLLYEAIAQPRTLYYFSTAN